MISKELLSLVLNEEFTRPSEFKIVGNNIKWYEMTIQNTPRYLRQINLDTLGRLCKEWCIKQGYRIMSGYYTNSEKYMIKAEVRKGIGLEARIVYVSAKCNTEIEAIIKATEWAAKDA